MYTHTYIKYTHTPHTHTHVYTFFCCHFAETLERKLQRSYDLMQSLAIYFLFFNLLIFEREREREKEREREREREREMLFHTFLHLLVVFCMCFDHEIKPVTLVYWDDVLTS